MTEENTQEPQAINEEPVVEDNSAELEAEQLAVLKESAKLMGIRFHPSIGLETLKTKINEAMKAKEKEEKKKVKEQAKAAEPNKVVPMVRRQISKAEKLRKEATRLIRVRIVCMNPNKREWPGEILCVKNKYIGSVKKYIPFNAEEGYHVPYALFKFIKERKCQIIINAKDQNGKPYKKGKLINEFSVEELPPLTPKELKELAQRQAMAAGAE